jgi:hypothetical protein
VRVGTASGFEIGIAPGVQHGFHDLLLGTLDVGHLLHSFLPFTHAS